MAGSSTCPKRGAQTEMEKRALDFAVSAFYDDVAPGPALRRGLRLLPRRLTARFDAEGLTSEAEQVCSA